MPEDERPLSLDGLVTMVAVRLMSAQAATSVTVSQEVLAILVEYFDVDVSFLRYNDHAIRASVLIAEWPPRDDFSEFDPLKIVYYEDADRVFAVAENFKKPTVFRPDDPKYQRRIQEGRSVEQSSVAAAPLVSGELTTGALGFVKFGDQEWKADELDALKAIASLFAQVQARVEAEERLRHFAEHDDLTGLRNRRALLRHLDDRLSSGRSGPVAVLYFDLDRLKTINDYLGHSAGDAFIRIVAQRLQDGAASTSLIARLGGDEFVVVPAEPTSVDVARQEADRLLELLRARVDIDGESLNRTVSVGVALGDPRRDSTSDLLRRADQAVLAAKGDGGNRVAVFTDQMSSETDYRNDIELHLPNAIDNGSLFLNYLPEVDMRTGEVLATEALVRWNHPTRGLLSPASFVTVAESMNLGGALGHWVLHTACREFARWRARGAGSGTVLRVNVSPVQLVTDGFAQEVSDVMTEFALERGSLCLEINESVIVQYVETAGTTLTELRALGVQVAIDDFGTGSSALSHLKSLPVDILKIDRSFVADLGSNPDDLALVRAVIALAQAFALQLVAEGVETYAAAETLLRHGCHRAQGFLFSRPLSAEDMGALLADGRVSVDFSATPTL